MGNGAFQNAPFGNAPYAKGYSCLWGLATTVSDKDLINLVVPSKKLHAPAKLLCTGASINQCYQ